MLFSLFVLIWMYTASASAEVRTAERLASDLPSRSRLLVLNDKDRLLFLRVEPLQTYFQWMTIDRNWVVSGTFDGHSDRHLRHFSVTRPVFNPKPDWTISRSLDEIDWCAVERTAVYRASLKSRSAGP